MNLGGNKTTSYIMLGVGLLAALATGYLIYSSQKPEPVFRIYTATGSIAASNVVDENAIDEVEVPERFSTLKKLIVFDEDGESRNLDWMTGRVSTCDMNPDDPILFSCFEAGTGGRLEDTIEPGTRAMTIGVTDESSVGFFIRPGSRVDVVGTVLEIVDNIERQRTFTMLQNVSVAAVGAATSDLAYRGVRDDGYDTVTIFVTPEDAEKLVHLRQQVLGPMTLVLRNPSDDRTIETSTVFTTSQ